MGSIEYQGYYKNVLDDFKELKKEYPFSRITILPTIEPIPVEIRVVAANRKLIEDCLALENDFTENYSKELNILIPYDYRKTGCEVYGGEWIDIGKIAHKDRHFLQKKGSLFQLCVGVPESYSHLKNVLLENVRTAENMLIAYENIMRGNTNVAELIAYSHGKKGEKEYGRNKSSFRSK